MRSRQHRRESAHQIVGVQDRVLGYGSQSFRPEGTQIEVAAQEDADVERLILIRQDPQHPLLREINFRQMVLRSGPTAGFRLDGATGSVEIVAFSEVFARYGNLLEEDFDRIWNGQRFVEFRERLHRDQGSIGICQLCSAYGVSTIS